MIVEAWLKGDIVRLPWRRRGHSTLSSAPYRTVVELSRAGRPAEAIAYAEAHASAMSETDWLFLSLELHYEGHAVERLELVRNRLGAPFPDRELAMALVDAGQIDQALALMDRLTESEQATILTVAFRRLRDTVNGDASAETAIDDAVGLYETHRHLATDMTKRFLVTAMMDHGLTDQLAHFLRRNASDPQIRDMDVLLGAMYGLGVGAELGSTPYPIDEWTRGPGATAADFGNGTAHLSALLLSNPTIVDRHHGLGPPRAEYRTGYSYFASPDELGAPTRRCGYHWALKGHPAFLWFEATTSGRHTATFRFDERSYPTTPDGWTRLMHSVNARASRSGPMRISTTCTRDE